MQGLKVTLFLNFVDTFPILVIFPLHTLNHVLQERITTIATHIIYVVLSLHKFIKIYILKVPNKEPKNRKLNYQIFLEFTCSCGVDEIEPEGVFVVGSLLLGSFGVVRLYQEESTSICKTINHTNQKSHSHTSHKLICWNTNKLHTLHSSHNKES